MKNSTITEKGFTGLTYRVVFVFLGTMIGLMPPGIAGAADIVADKSGAVPFLPIPTVSNVTPLTVPPEQAKASRPALTALDRLPLYFIENQGQIDPTIRFYERSATGRQTVFTSKGVTLSVPMLRMSNEAKSSTRAIQIVPLGARSHVEMVGESAQTGRVNWYVGSDRSRWKGGLPTYRAVRYKEIYPGIDWAFYGNQGNLEYDFIIRPGADPSRIRLQVEGADGLRLTSEGQLAIDLSGGVLHQQMPVIYQEIDGRRVKIEGQFKLFESKKDRPVYGFTVGVYNHAYALIIDPIIYSTYLGGVLDEAGSSIAVDGTDAVYVTGKTNSSDFPTLGAVDTSFGGGYDVFVTKLSPDGSSLVYSTYLGGSGSGNDEGFDIAVDGIGAAYVTGTTNSSDFPTTLGAFDPFIDNSLNGFSDVFVTKLSPGGSLVYSTYLGGSSNDEGFSIAVDGTGAAYITGRTTPYIPGETTVHLFFPTTFGAFDTTFTSFDGINDIFVTKLSPDGSSLIYSTYLGGSGDEEGISIAVDGAGVAYITGTTDSANFPVTLTAFDPSLDGSSDAFVTKLSPDGSALLYSTYLGGSDDDYGYGIAVDGAGAAYVTGSTSSSNFFTTSRAFDTVLDGFADAFVTKLSSDGSALLYSTYLGGSDFEEGSSIAVDGTGVAYVTGGTNSLDFPTTPMDSDVTPNGGNDVFVTRLSADGGSLIYSTYLGGIENEFGSGIVVSGPGFVYVVGTTNSFDFPTTLGAHDTSYGGSFDDSFVAKLLAGKMPLELCNGIDDDFNLLIDEGFPDTDGDSIADCIDPDDDNDTIPDGDDACPLLATTNTIMGTDEDDDLIGTDDADMILGLEGDDDILGEEGNDCIVGGPGSDRMNGDDGDDTLQGGDGADRLVGDDGDDILSGGDGNDKLYGNEGTDTLSGDTGNDNMNGGGGDDHMDGGDGNDTLYGKLGNDTLSGGNGNDALYGEYGDDTIDGGAGNDRLFGRSGNDILSGGEGNDDLHGQNGNDTLSGDAGADRLRGGMGKDVLNGGLGVDSCAGGSGADTAADCEKISSVP